MASIFSLLQNPVYNVFSLTLCSQDVDSIFLTKEELEAKVDVLAQELEALRCVFAQVKFLTYPYIL